MIMSVFSKDMNTCELTHNEFMSATTSYLTTGILQVPSRTYVWLIAIQITGRMATEGGTIAKTFKTSCIIGYQTRANVSVSRSARAIANITRSLKGLGKNTNLCCHPSHHLLITLKLPLLGYLRIHIACALDPRQYLSFH
ncbi:hypothetical protein Naga_100092g6 [Nannochloropsis gaditana]|uniref:Uncharacterized protein n=1 Tax=Nannochloropsis gaditana TaxID=72520 RepID=W7TWD2_9STRA|nr:hypothetical protein Naga_100092g6 [Nannochloropsis gaditana]